MSIILMDDLKQEIADEYGVGKENVNITITSHSRGWDIYFDGEDWRYSDNNQIYDDSRPCKRCGRMPSKEGYDACLGHIDGVKSACCGHGVEDSYVVKERD